MNIFRRLWNWVRSLFRKEKKEEKRYELVSTLFNTEFDIVGRGPSAWNSDAGGRYVDYIGFRRLECVREGDGYWAERCRVGVTAVMRVLSDPKNIYEGCKAVGLTNE